VSEPFTREDMVDAIATAISDSMDVDWTSRTGAEAVVRNCGVFELYEAAVATIPALEDEIKSLTDSYINRIGPDVGKVTDPDGIEWINQFQEPLDRLRAAVAKIHGEQVPA
jgi:hypothetical protein